LRFGLHLLKFGTCVSRARKSRRNAGGPRRVVSSGVVMPPDADRDLHGDAASPGGRVQGTPSFWASPCLPTPSQSADANTQRHDVSSHRSDVTSQCAVASLHRADVTSHSSDVTSHRADVTLHRTVATSHCSDVTLHRTVATSHSSVVTSYRSVATLHRTDVSSHFSVASSHRADVSSHRAVASSQNAVGSPQFLLGWACLKSQFMKRLSGGLQLPAAARRRSRSRGCPGRSRRRRLPGGIPRARGPGVPRSGR